MQYTAAVKTSSLEPTAKAISSLATLVERDPKLVAILNAPSLSSADKSAVVAELVKSAGVTGETVKNFLSTLAEYNRLGLLPGVVTKFAELMSAARGEVEMTVTSAQVWRSRPPDGAARRTSEDGASAVGINVDRDADIRSK